MSVMELQCVIAIIALVAAPLLPAVGQAGARVRRTRCINHLHQAGVGFVNFADEPNGRFPMGFPPGPASRAHTKIVERITLLLTSYVGMI